MRSYGGRFSSAPSQRKCFYLNEVGAIYEGEKSIEAETILVEALTANEPNLRFVAYCYLKRQNSQERGIPAALESFEAEARNIDLVETAKEQLG